MIFAAPVWLDIPTYRPKYEEIASDSIAAGYRAMAAEMVEARERSEYLRRELTRTEVRKRLAGLVRLRGNWDTYGSEAPSRDSVEAAGKIAEACIDEGLYPDAIVPSAEGGVALCFVRHGRYADIELFNSGEILAVRYSKDEDPVSWTVEKNLGATYDAIRAISKYISA